MSKTPNYDAKVKVLLDATQAGERVCALTGEKWVMTEEEIGWYKKFNVPPARTSPQTRWKVHGLWYVGYQFWYQKHPETGKPIVTTVHPASGIKVLPDREWFEKDFIEKGRGYSVSEPFFQQFHDLQLAVPMSASRHHIEPKNSIASVSHGDEDSFFVGFSKSKRCLYSHIAMDAEDSAEMYQAFSIQNSYNIVHSRRIFNSKFVRESFDCLNSSFLFDCRNCEYCFGATNKRNRKYVWFNEQLSQGAWEAKLAEVDLGSRRVLTEYQDRFSRLVAEQGIWPENFNDSETDSTGEYLNKVSRVREGYLCEDGGVDQFRVNISVGASQNNAFSGSVISSTDNYYCASVSRSSDCRFSFVVVQSAGLEYCTLCYNCENCFGCVGLQRKRFCIFNKEYAEEEYWRRVDELKSAMLDRGEYGEYLPVAFSPSYHEYSGGPHWFGATEEDRRNMGVLDYDPECLSAIGQDLTDAAELRPSDSVPDHIRDLTSEWIGIALLDRSNNRRFKFIEPEVAFYRRLNIAPPTKHFIRRVHDLYAQANQGVFEDAACGQCQKALRVAKNAGHPKRTIYCRPCYLTYLEKNS